MACELTDATPMVLNAKSAADDTNSAHLLRNKVFEEEETSKDDASFSSIGARSKRPRSSSFARVPNRESIDDDITERERVLCGDFFWGDVVVQSSRGKKRLNLSRGKTKRKKGFVYF